MPRTTVLYIATSLDGYIAGPNDELDWLFTDQDYGYGKFFDSIDTIVMGRRSYDISKSLGEWPYVGKTCYVLTHTTGQIDANVIFTDEDPVRIVEKLRALEGKSIWIFGGGQIATAVAAAYLIDEYVIAIHPVLLGAGLPLWTGQFSRVDPRLDKIQSFDSGLVMLSYSSVR